MVKKEFYPLDFGYDNTGNVVIYGKTTGNERIVVKDDSIKPFFYVFENGKKAGEIENVRIKEENKIYKVLKTEIVKKKYFDKEVNTIKVYVNNNSDINHIKDRLKELSQLNNQNFDKLFIKKM